MRKVGYYETNPSDDYYNRAQEVLYCRVPWKGNLKRNRSMMLAMKKRDPPREITDEMYHNTETIRDAWAQYNHVCIWRLGDTFHNPIDKSDKMLNYGRYFDDRV